MDKKNKGYIKSIRGSVVEAVFEEKLPALNNKLVAGENQEIIMEVNAYINDQTIKAIALTFTAGISRGDSITDTGKPIMVPVGKEVLGKMFDVFGNTLDGSRLEESVTKKSIHQKPVVFSKRSTSDEIFLTGIKVIDILTPLAK